MTDSPYIYAPFNAGHANFMLGDDPVQKMHIGVRKLFKSFTKNSSTTFFEILSIMFSLLSHYNDL